MIKSNFSIYSSSFLVSEMRMALHLLNPHWSNLVLTTGWNINLGWFRLAQEATGRMCQACAMLGLKFRLIPESACLAWLSEVLSVSTLGVAGGGVERGEHLYTTNLKEYKIPKCSSLKPICTCILRISCVFLYVLVCVQRVHMCLFIYTRAYFIHTYI